MIWALRKNADQDLSFKMPDIVLRGFRVILRPPRLQDWQPWLEVRKRNRAFLKPYEPSWAHDWSSMAYFQKRLSLQARNWQEDLACSFLIFKNEDGALIGGMNVNNICRGAAQYASLGYWLDEDHQGQGYMAEAVNLTVQYCFRQLRLNRVHAASLLHNTRSQNLLLRCGFTQEGMARNYLKINGRWQDHLLFGLNAQDRTLPKEI